jgi:hypothetical protein
VGSLEQTQASTGEECPQGRNEHVSCGNTDWPGTRTADMHNLDQHRMAVSTESQEMGLDHSPALSTA